MIISPFYDEIKVRTMEMLNDPEGFNGHSKDEMISWGKHDRWVSRNSIGVALCYARDELLRRLSADGGVPGYVIARNVVRFNVGNFRKAEAEIYRQLMRRSK